MTEEEYFRKNYPDACYGDKPLSPYWDFFQDGVEFGERQSEKKIAEVEKENAELRKEWQEQVQKATDEGYARTLQTIQLTKAIEIIKTLADDLSMYSGNYQKELLEAKQFLKENSTYERIQKAKYNYTD